MTSTNPKLISDPALCEPFINGRETGRLLYDLGAMISLFNPALLDSKILDFGAGSCWITESIAKMGHKITAFDIHPNLKGCIDGRANADARLDQSLIDHAIGDGHEMPFANATFGHLLCYDTLHHMRDFDRVFYEFSRVLKPGGRAIFVEPGAEHANSLETKEFLKLKAHDPTWIERSIVLEDIDTCARRAGFSELKLVPLPHANDLLKMPLSDWLSFRNGSRSLTLAVTKYLLEVNYNQRVVFFCDKLKL